MEEEEKEEEEEQQEEEEDGTLLISNEGMNECRSVGTTRCRVALPLSGVTERE